MQEICSSGLMSVDGKRERDSYTRARPSIYQNATRDEIRLWTDPKPEMLRLCQIRIDCDAVTHEFVCSQPTFRVV